MNTKIRNVVVNRTYLDNYGTPFDIIQITDDPSDPVNLAILKYQIKGGMIGEMVVDKEWSVSLPSLKFGY